MNAYIDMKVIYSYMNVYAYIVIYMNIHIFRNEIVWGLNGSNGKEGGDEWKVLNMRECAQCFNTYLYENIFM